MLRRFYKWLCSLFRRKQLGATRQYPDKDECTFLSYRNVLNEWLAECRKERKLRVHQSAGSDKWTIEVADFAGAFMLFKKFPCIGHIRVKESAGISRFFCLMDGNTVLSLTDDVRSDTRELARMRLYTLSRQDKPLKIHFIKSTK